MDGEAIIGSYGTQAGPDCLRDVLPKYGQRIKVYKAIKDTLGENISNEICQIYNFYFYLSIFGGVQLLLRIGTPVKPVM